METMNETMTTTEDALRVAEGTFILNLTIGAIRTSAKVKRERVEKMAEALRVEEPETPEEMAADGADEIRVNKELLKVPEISDLIAQLNAIRFTIRTKALNDNPTLRKRKKDEKRRVSFLKRGLYLYPATLVEWAEVRIAEAQAKIDEALDALESKWEAILREDERRLAPLGLFDAADYPSLARIREATRIRYAWMRFAVPEALAEINRAVFEAERKKAAAMWSEMYDEIRLAYRETLQQFVEKIRAALVPGEDGKRRVLRQSTLDNLTEFLNAFRLQDVTNDTELRALIDRAKAALNGSDAEVLRTEPRASARVATAMEEIGAAVQELVITQGRKVRLRD